MFTVHFTVSIPFSLHADQFIFVSGSHDQLGNWDTSRALKLRKTETGFWTGSVNLGVETVKFRYFIGCYLQSESGKEPILAISKWETHLTPRAVMPPVEATKTRICRANLNDIFGFNGGREHISDGFVLSDGMNQITLAVFGSALKFYKQKTTPNYRIKVVSFDLRDKLDISNFDDEDEQAIEDEQLLPSLSSHSFTEIAALTQENPKFHAQDETGELFRNSIDYYVFRTYSVAVEYLSFRIEIYSCKTNGLVAQGYALPSALPDTYGKTSVPLLTKKGLPVGKIYFGYLFIRPIHLPHPHPTMHNCYAKHWKKRATLEVGHRGMGNSYTKFAVARENTLHSLNSAAKNGADFVEFDVHLTKDKIPIVFHDFHVMVSVAKRVLTIADTEDGNKQQQQLTELGVDFYQLAVKDLKLNQLRLLHLDHVKHHPKSDRDEESNSNLTNIVKGLTLSHSHQRVTGGQNEAEEHRPFPTLNEALKNVSTQVGFNIEIKYPQMLVNGENECDGYFERNEFVDIILAEVLNHADNRRIVFSSFEPDICKMVSAKQKKYPVLLLCLGESTRHINYADERIHTSMTAVKFAYATGLMGVNFNSEDLLRDPTPLTMAKELGLISFVWGDDLIEKKHVDYFKKTLGVEGIIYDRIGETETRTNIFTLEKAMKTALFSKKSTSNSSPRCYSHTHLHDDKHPNRTRSSSAWTSSHGYSDQNDNINSMLSIGELVEFPIIRRHNSSQINASVNNVPTIVNAIQESSSLIGKNGVAQSTKQFMMTASEI